MKLHAEIIKNDGLTPAESQVFALLCEGLSNQAIANQLEISIKTVSCHIDHVYEKLGLRWASVNRRAAAIAYAVASGMVRMALRCVIAVLVVQTSMLDDEQVQRVRSRLPRVRIVRPIRKEV